MFYQLKTIIPGAIKHYRLARQFEASELCAVCTRFFKERFGEEAQTQIWPQSFKEGVLTVSVSHAGWAEAVKLCQEELLIYIEQTLLQNTAKIALVKRIRLVVRGNVKLA